MRKLPQMDMWKAKEAGCQTFLSVPSWEAEGRKVSKSKEKALRRTGRLMYLMLQ
jgi:hypothetical protein